MAQNASEPVTAPRKPTVDSVAEEIARTRERLSATLIQIKGDVRAILDPDTPVAIATPDHRDATDKVVVGLRTAGQITALARPGKTGAFGILTAVTGLTVFLFRSGIARRIFNRKSNVL